MIFSFIHREGDNPIPPNAKITYEIELLAVRDGPDMDTMSDDERIKIGWVKNNIYSFILPLINSFIFSFISLLVNLIVIFCVIFFASK